ncbi:type 4a pilus biogenesis protein PilO [Saccharospirillum sp. HFRX-1]|uniref:type 4a pilus biogenesis protein PilO n=1 Tax=unclassified Saccharospirillum TaxID=2633430 RepID=UPI0037119B74
MRRQGMAALVEEVRRFDYQHLNVDNLGSWPRLLRLLVLLGVVVLMLGAGWFLVLANHQERLARAVSSEAQLQQQYRQQLGQTEHPEVLGAELETLQQGIDAALRSLPSQLDLPELIDDISRAATAAGLIIDQITPGEERQQSIFAQTPIRIVMRGGYHQLGGFIAALSALPGQISLHQLTMTLTSVSEQPTDLAGPLLITLEARAYRQTSAGEE